MIRILAISIMVASASAFAPIRSVLPKAVARELLMID